MIIASVSEVSSAQLRLLDLTGQPVEPLKATQAKAVVFLFTRTDCPISNRYAPEVRRLHEKFAAGGVTFWLVYPDPDESVEMIRQHIKEYEYHLGVLRDPQHALVKVTGVRVTPEVAVFVSGQIVYRGRIDNRYVAFGKTRPAPTTHDLEAILEAILKGKPVANTNTTAIGCFIPDL
jgi:peroxiredoxin